MINIQKGVCVFLCLVFGFQVAFAAETPDTNDIDAFWAEVVRTVVEGDFEAYKATYHADAILVSGFTDSTQPIEKSFTEWEQGFSDTRTGKNQVTLEFRFTQRFRDPTTAHDTGIFYYTSTGEDGVPKETYAHFEALLIKQNEWKTLMEYQKSIASKADWEAAGTAPLME